MIDVQMVSKRFTVKTGRLVRKSSTVDALREVSFSAPAGRITGLLGPNGAGKTTLIRILAGLLVPEHGRVTMNGLDTMRDAARLRCQLGVLGDAKGLYPRLTARENIRYFGRLQGLADSALAPRIEQLIAQLGMEDIADRPATGFSQGERMKTALARALVHDPQIVLLDEPTNGLDIMATRAVRGLIRHLRETGKTVLFSSHVMQEVSALCDQVVVIGHGRVVASTTPDALVQQTGQTSLEDAFIAALGLPVGEGA